ncbi:GspE/PulE family protein [Luteitalea pratensis]|uniref:GspE/PulE family protein n=1 Tax=Luteitalea pratensis TaxID=1855912 RepID=UPI001F375BAB|nr:GspE/PulE family protein [Luteitalea pratensis]
MVTLLLKEQMVTDAQVRHAERVQGKLETPRSLLTVLQDLQIVSADQIRQAVRANPQSMRLGDLLIDLGHLRESDLRAALAAQQAAGGKKRLGEILVESRVMSEHRLTEVLADLLGLPLLEPRVADIDRVLLARMNLRRAQECALIPVSQAGGRVTVAFADPLDATHRMAAEQMFGGNVVPAIARRSLVVEALAAFERGLRANAVPTEHTAMQIVVDLIREALETGTSDIHIEPLQAGLRVRFRLDGVMVEHRTIDRDLGTAVVSRIKVLAGADIAERRRHQDGRIKFEDPETGAVADIRASFYVTIHGEKVVLRLLNRKTELISIRDIGMGPRMLERFVADALEVPTGVVIITGPTGSGKTTTLYSAVDHLNTPDTSIVTAEDPVEYVVDGIAQCSINAKINRTFEETLRHIVRQDPDVIVLGEMRDRFSADTAIQAALTGHKVLTTFHTEDAIGGLLRLLNMNIEAFLISSTVVSVVAQRLLRRVCAHCAEPYTPTASEIRRLGVSPQDLDGATFTFGRGCSACRYTGYRGRICVFELLVLNELVKDAILNRRTSYEIRRISVETSGLVALVEDGLYKASYGMTTIQEVLRHLPRVVKPRPVEEIRRLLGSLS